MILPGDRRERHQAFVRMIQNCEMNSRETRRGEADYLSRQYELGGDAQAEYNMLAEMVDRASSYLFDHEALRLEVELPKRYGALFVEEEDAARDDLEIAVQDDGDLAVVSQAVRYAHVWPSVFCKLFGRGEEIRLGMLSSPADFGTPYEDRETLAELPYFTHWYTLTPSEFETRVASHSKYETLMRHVLDHAQAPDRPMSQTLPPTLLISQASPTMIGSVNQMPTPRAMPTVREPVAKLAELWWFDNEIADYRMATMFVPTREILWETLTNPLEIRGEHPFRQLCLSPTPGFLYGRAMLQKLIPLQQRVTEVLTGIWAINARQRRPAVLFDGFPGIVEERAERVVAEGGVLSSPMPGASMRELVPAMPPDIFAVLRETELRARRMWGLPESYSGEAQANVRSGQQESELALLGSPVLRERAGMTASFIEAVLTLKLRMRQKELATPLRKGDDRDAAMDMEDGSRVLLSQLPDELFVRVWGHSASPVSAAAIERKAILAKREGGIGAETFIEYLGLPFSEKARAEARRLAKARAQYQGLAMQLKDREVKAKEAKAMK